VLSSKKRNNKYLFIIIASALVGVGIVALVLVQNKFTIIPHSGSNSSLEEKASFPAIEGSQLTTNQQKVVEILKTEYTLNPSGTKYSNGIEEAWCADFVSWVFNEAGVPLINPNSGSWRIPGTYTLREYYESKGDFKLADTNYSPKVGDIMLYDNPSPFGQHTNIVIKNENGIVTTIGGNEPGGIRIVKHTKPDTDGFIGYGIF